MAITRLGAEDVLDAINDMLESQLNTYIVEQNTERADSITLVQIPSGGFFFQELPPDLNINPWVLTAIGTPIEVKARGPAIAKTFTVSVYLGTSGAINNKMEDIQRMFMRYTDAICRCVTKNFSILSGFSLTEITQVPQAAEIETQSGEVIRVAGVQMTAVIA